MSVPSTLELTAVVFVVAATASWINAVWFRIPNQIALLLSGLLVSGALVAFDLGIPALNLSSEIEAMLGRIDLSATLLEGMLGFLLFAGALHIDLSRLKSRKWIVGAMATVGVAVSTLVIGAGFWIASRMLGVEMPFTWSLLFGALISPTDPVAVLSTIKDLDVPEELEMDIAGESLFNDGVAIVLFAGLLAIVAGPGDVSPQDMIPLFLQEAVGGICLGFGGGYLAYSAMRRIDDYAVEVLISIALVTATYALALAVHVSGPLAVVSAGVLIGNRGAACAMSERTRRYLFGFWDLTEEMLNSVLFLLIGLEVLLVRYEPVFLVLSLMTLPIVIAARYIAVAAPVFALRDRVHFLPGTISILTWAGVRGGISIALALSLPPSPYRLPILASTYAVAVFTILVQGSTLGPYISKFDWSSPRAAGKLEPASDVGG